ncbi:MAG: N-6 DNA methylase [Muribaculaceae bacterium]|nr:N-6 DNA methylase [Muribaculaceae bacterium]
MEFDRPYSRQEFIRFLKGFLSIDAQLNEQQIIPFRTKTNFATVATRLGSCELLDLNVYEVKHNSRNDGRVGLSKDAFRLIADEGISRALVVFVPEDSNDNYRFSLVELTLSWDDNDKVGRSYSNPRRYSYYLGKGVAYYTPNKYLNEPGRILSVEDLRNRFSVEILTKAFYNELSDWYAWAIKEIQFPNDITTTKDDTEYNHIAAIRLITRLIFVWFIKQRGLIPWQFFDEDYIRENLLENFNPNVKVDLFYKATDSKYYRAILQNLFFAMLNAPLCKEGSKEITERKFKDNRGQFDDNKLMRYRHLFKNPDLFLQLANSTVPFLNGGLFDCLDDKKSGMYYDGFSERKESIAQLRVPDYLFFGEEVGRGIDLSEYYGDKNKKKVSARGIIDILKRYNFTVEENMPFDKDISLDPELLGKVFENLLAAYNPETKQTARKQTGSFYTPREIVQYMVDESLIAHLKRTVSEELEAEYRKLLSYTDDIINLTEEQKQQVMLSLYNCRILDPACGSGAFPVGILQQMVHILTQIDPDNSRWQKMLFDLAQDESSEVFKNSTEEERKEQLDDLYHSFNADFNRPDYSRKLYLIENCIYGVDIQPIAIQISKLRFFISLIIDQKPNNDPVDNFGIRPLPNLEAKFVAANSLIGLKREEGNLFNTKEIKEKENQLKIAKHKIFGAKTARTKRKYENQVTQLREDIASMLLEQRLVGNEQAQQLAQWDMSDQNASSPFFDPEWMFGVKDGFDIVIANPPYVDAKKLKSQSKILKDNFLIYNGAADLYTYFYERGIKLLVPNGILTYITSNKWIRSDYGENLRKLILDNSLRTLIDFGRNRFFNATVDTNILMLSRGNRILKKCIYYIDHVINPHDISTYTNNPIENTDLSNGPWLLNAGDNDSIKIKLESHGTPLGSLNVDFFRGILTGCNEAYHVTTYEKDLILSSCESQVERNITEQLFVPILRGKDIAKYSYQWHDLWLINVHNGVKNKYHRIDISQYPSVKKHLDTYISKLTKRTDKGSTPYNLRNCAYLDTFRCPKIIWQAISKRQAFSLDLSGDMYGDVSTFYLTGEKLPYIAGVLNSKIFEYALINIYLEGDTFKSKNAILQNFPMPKCNFHVESKIESYVLDIVSNHDLCEVLMPQIDFLVYHLYDLTYDEVLIVDPETPITRDQYENFNIQ